MRILGSRKRERVTTSGEAGLCSRAMLRVLVELRSAWEIRNDPIIGRHYRETHNAKDQDQARTWDKRFIRRNEY